MTDLLDRLLDEADRLLPITVGDASDGEISAALLEVADHPMAVDVFIGLSRSGNERSIFAAIEMIGLTPDPAAMTEIVRAIADGLGFEDEVVGTIHATMVRRAADRGAHPGLRSHALLGALHLSQDSPARMFRLLSFLVDISTDDDATFLKHAAKVIGLVQAHRPEPELEAILGRIAGIDEVRDEAAMEIGLIELRRGLEGRNRVTALAAFSAAKDWFVEACAATEVRLDAELYGQSLGMLLDFQQGRRSGPAADEVAAIRQTAFEYAVYAAPASARLRGSWLVDRVSETMGWSTLAVTLGNLEDSLADTVWLDAMTVIERQLLNCYSASRSILRAGADGGVEEIVRPAIVDALQREQTKLQMLEEWTRRNGASDMVADARALQACVVAAREASALRNPTEAAAPAGVAAVLSSGLVTPEMAKALDAFAFDNTKYFLDSVAPVVVSQWQELRNALAANADYASNADARRMLDFMLMRLSRGSLSSKTLSAERVPGRITCSARTPKTFLTKATYSPTTPRQ